MDARPSRQVLDRCTRRALLDQVDRIEAILPGRVGSFRGADDDSVAGLEAPAEAAAGVLVNLELKTGRFGVRVARTAEGGESEGGGGTCRG